MLKTVPIVAMVTLLTLAPAVEALRRSYRQTALQPAWPWAALAWLVTVAVLLVEGTDALGYGPAQMAWYAAAVLALAPGIAALGARWPTARVWNLFVVLPLLAVFSWPIAVPALRGSRLERWQLEEPMVLAYGLVLLMGAGNYLGTRKTLSVLAAMAGWMLVVFSVCPTFLPGGWSPRDLRAVAAGFFTLAALLFPRHPPAQPISQTPIEGWQRLLAEFHELFGMVWTRRLQERFHDQTRRAGLPVTWAWGGLEPAPISETSPRAPHTPTSAGPAPPSSTARQEQAGLTSPVAITAAQLDPVQFAAADQMLRWLLAKFVEPAWIEARVARPLPPAPLSTPTRPPPPPPPPP